MHADSVLSKIKFLENIKHLKKFFVSNFSFLQVILLKVSVRHVEHVIHVAIQGMQGSDESSANCVGIIAACGADDGLNLFICNNITL